MECTGRPERVGPRRAILAKPVETVNSIRASAAVAKSGDASLKRVTQAASLSNEVQKLLTDGDLQDEGNGMAERVGFEPTCRLPDKTLSRRPRYDHFGTSPVEGRALNTAL